MKDYSDLWAVVRSIPAGKVASYGEVGRSLPNPTSGYFVGRWMANCPTDIPWWRVVAKDGTLPVWKRDPALENEQADRLRAEGVDVKEGKVDMQSFAADLDSV